MTGSPNINRMVPWRPCCAILPSGVVYPVHGRRDSDSDVEPFKALVGEPLDTKAQRSAYLMFYCVVALQTTAVINRARAKL